MKHTWLKLLTSILWSKKFRKLPDNDHRIVYFGLLILTKLGLENEPEVFVAPTLFVSIRKLKAVKKVLSEVGLLDDQGAVIGFEESQLTIEAARKRRQRSRDKGRDMSRDKSRDNPRDSHGTSHGDSRSKSKSKKEGGDCGNRTPRGNSRANADPPPGDFQKVTKPGSAPGPEALARNSQVQMLEEMAGERGTYVQAVAEEICVRFPIRASDVTAVRRALEARRRVGLSEKAELAKAAAFVELRAQMATVFDFEGAAAAKRWIDHRDLDAALRRSLLASWQTIVQSNPDDQPSEATQ